MCGIFAVISSQPNNSNIKDKALENAKKMTHRGPDGTGYFQSTHGIFVHNRLSIIDPKGGSQPLLSNNNEVILCVNGEIFNYKNIKYENNENNENSENLNNYSKYEYKTGSDCETILALYDNVRYSTNDMNNVKILTHLQIVNILSKLDGQFSFILHDTVNKMTLVARDPFGITQLYYGITNEGLVQISSEMRSLEECTSVNVFPSGRYMYFHACTPELKLINYFVDTPDGSWLQKIDTINTTGYENYYSYDKQDIIKDEFSNGISGEMKSGEMKSGEINYNNNIELEHLLNKIRITFETSVHKRLMSDVKFGILLSGGLDSSLVASVAVKYIRLHKELYGENPEIHTFSIGMEDSSDLRAARIVSKFLGTIHHEVIFTEVEALATLEEMINVLETYDITTIRASLPMYLLTKTISKMGIKMVLSGEGSDELLGGYLYFHQAPNDEEHQLECKKRILDLGYFDCLRADKSSMGSSVEIRVPFLDTKFVKLCININKDVKTQNGIEKYILRKAFDVKVKDENSIENTENTVNTENTENTVNTDNTIMKPLYLPDIILWRQKVQFSDGVGSNHIDSLKSYSNTQVLNNYLTEYNNRNVIYPYNTPATTEAFYYRKIFEKLFPNRASTVKCWIPNTKWDGVSSDPSGRCQKAFREDESYDKK